jgi:hypothetical protein
MQNVNATTFSEILRKTWDSNPTPQTALLINRSLEDMAKRIKAQAQAVAAPAALTRTAIRLLERIQGGGDDILRVIQADWSEDPPGSREKLYKQTIAQLFSGYPHGAEIEDEFGIYSTAKIKGDAFEVATLWNQVGAIDNPLQQEFFSNGIANFLAKSMVSAVVTVGNAIGSSDTLDAAVQNWNVWTQKVKDSADEMIAKAMSPWLWFAIGAGAMGAFWLWTRKEDEDPK